jgi:1-acyl-sn-glycerol-3-phosphate acyltransferase
VLPSLINPVRRCTFVIKPSLMGYPVFGPVMRSRDPIVVTRDNPRQDLQTVLDEGARRLAAGTSIVLFPQTTRSGTFDPAKFNSLGVKLAKNAGVPIVPVALKTDAWANGSMLKDFGPIYPHLPIHIEFAAPLPVEGNGREQQEAAVAFISSRLSAWRGERG